MPSLTLPLQRYLGQRSRLALMFLVCLFARWVSLSRRPSHWCSWSTRAAHPWLLQQPGRPQYPALAGQASRYQDCGEHLTCHLGPNCSSPCCLQESNQMYRSDNVKKQQQQRCPWSDFQHGRRRDNMRVGKYARGVSPVTRPALDYKQQRSKRTGHNGIMIEQPHDKCMTATLLWNSSDQKGGLMATHSSTHHTLSMLGST